MNTQYFYEVTTRIYMKGMFNMSNKSLKGQYTHGVTGNILDGMIHIPPEENINRPNQYVMGRGMGIPVNPLGNGSSIISPIDPRCWQQDIQNTMKAPTTLSVDLNHILANEYVNAKIIYKSSETLVLQLCGKEVVFTTKQHGDIAVKIGNSTEPLKHDSLSLKHILEDKSKGYSFRMEFLTGNLVVDIDGIGLGGSHD